MPYKKAPDRAKGLPSHAQSIWVSAFNSAYKQYNGDEEKANATAWSAVKKAGYRKNDKGKWIKASESFHYLVQLSEGEDLPSTIEIMRQGKWNHPVYGLFEITDNTMTNIISNFDNKVRGVDISFDLEHGETSHKTEAVCWVKKLLKKGTSLLAEVEWTDFGKEKIKTKAFKYFSPEFKFNYEDPETGKQYNNVLFGGGLTNRPFIKRMSPIMLSETVNTNDLNSELYTPCKLEGEGKQSMNKKLLGFLKLSETSTEEEINTAVEKVIEDSTKLAETLTLNETLKKELETLKGEKETLANQLNTLNDSKTDVEKANVKLNERINEIEKTLKESEWENIYNVALSEKKMTPAMAETFKTQFMANPEVTKNLIGCLQPIVSLNEEQGSSNTTDEVSHLKLFDVEVQKIMSAKNVKYDVALLEARASKPDLFKLADAERKGVN